MLRILILEDQKLGRETLKRFIEENDSKVKIHADTASSFDEAKTFLFGPYTYDGFFLDVNLDYEDEDDKGGIEFAQIIRSIRKYEFTPVIMVSSMLGFEMEAYRKVHCYQYITKPYMKKDIRDIVDKIAALKTTVEEKYVTVKKDGINYRIKADDIVYIEAVPRGVCLYLKEDSLKILYLTLARIQKILPDNFIKVHRMCVINKKYIENIDYVNRLIKLSNYSEPVELGGTYKQSVREQMEN